ncbi:MAG: tetratricopeptide repeat protein [Planctomycetota bacterium]
MKNKNSQARCWMLDTRCSSRIKNRESRIKNRESRMLLVIGYWLLVNHLPFTIYHLPYSAAAVGQKSPQSSLTILPDPNSNFRRQLWRAELSIAKGEKDKGTKNELKRIIEQIRSIKFETQKETFEPIVVPKVVLIDEPNEAVSETKEQEKKEIGTKLPYEPITDQTLQILKDLSQHLDHLRNSFELGETLVLSGNLKEAAIFYQEALKRKSPDDVGSARDRAWILFQIGNCLRNDDPITAMKMYGQLITEYPNSPWKELAEARSKLLNWFLTDKPGELIAEHKL